MEAIQTASAYIFSIQGMMLVVIGTILGITMGNETPAHIVQVRKAHIGTWSSSMAMAR